MPAWSHHIPVGDGGGYEGACMGGAGTDWSPSHVET